MGQISTKTHRTPGSNLNGNLHEGYSEDAFSRERALEEIRRIDERIAAIDETARSLTDSTSTRDGVGSEVRFDMSQIVASRYQDKADELGLTAPGLHRADYTPQEQATYEIVSRAIISDYYDQRVAPYRDLIPERGSVVGNLSGPGNFNEADLRASGPRSTVGRPRNLTEGSPNSAISERIDEGARSLGQRLDANTTRMGQGRQEFDDARKGNGGADNRMNERFYDKDQR